MKNQNKTETHTHGVNNQPPYETHGMFVLCEICNERPWECVHLKEEFKDKVTSKNHRLVAKKHPEYFENLCTICHAELEGMSAKQSELKRLVIIRDRLIMQKNVLDNQNRNFGRIEYKVPETFDNRSIEIKKEIKDIEKQIKELLNSHHEIENHRIDAYPIWNILKEVKGIGEMTAAKLIAFIDINNTPTVSALWRYCGLDATHIKRKKKITQIEAKKFGNPYLKKEILGILGDSFIKQRTPIYRQIYDEEKTKQMQIEGMTKGHAHRRAIRKMMKIFMSNFWVEWRTSEGLPVTKPWIFNDPNHTHLINGLNQPLYTCNPLTECEIQPDKICNPFQ